MLRAYGGEPALAELANALQKSTDHLMVLQAERVSVVKALISVRVHLKLADHRSDGVIRSVARAVEEADGGKNGRIATLVYPQGTTTIIKLFGESQVAAMTTLEDRIKAAGSTWPAASGHATRVAQARAEYQDALQKRATAMRLATEKRVLRDVGKEEFLDTFDSVANSIRQLFPRDRARQDLFFDRISTRRRGSEDAADDQDVDSPDE